MSRTNQVCVCCEERYNCSHYDTRRTVCVPIDTGWNSLEPCGLPQPTPVRLIEPVKLNTDWQHYRIQAAIAAMQGMIVSDAYADTKIVNNMTYETSRTKWDNIKIAKAAVAHADALIKELKGGE